MPEAPARFGLSAEAALARQAMSQSCGLAEPACDRLALSLALAIHGGPADHPLRGRVTTAGGAIGLHPQQAPVQFGDFDAADDFAGHAYLRPAWPAAAGTELTAAALGSYVDAGYRYLNALAATHGDWPAALGELVAFCAESPGNAAADSAAVSPVRIELGKDAETAQPIHWTVNAEDGQFSHASVRIAGDLGKGKSQALLGLLLAVTQQSPRTGFVVLDYKGDLSENAGFIAATQATVLRPQFEPIPINPFDLAKGADARLAPVRFAATLASLDKHIGAVQQSIVERALDTAYAAARRQGHHGPSLDEAAAAVQAEYQRIGRGDDSVTAMLGSLAKTAFFAQRSAIEIGSVFGQRWIVDLKGLGELRTRIAFLLLHFLHEAAAASADAHFDRQSHCRQLRGIVAVDEAHYYLRQGARCLPLLELLRVGRSKGVPVFLSSQSLDDFKGETELSQQLPNTFLFCHGAAPDARTVESVLRVDRKVALQLANASIRLPQHQVLTPHGRGADGIPRPMRMLQLFERLTERGSRP